MNVSHFRCQHGDCRNDGNPCFEPRDGEFQDSEPDAWFCAEHTNAHGFCRSCGQRTDSFTNGACDVCLEIIQEGDDDPDADAEDDDDSPAGHNLECTCEHCIQNYPERMIFLEDEGEEEQGLP